MAIDLKNGYQELFRLFREGTHELYLSAYGDRDDPEEMTIHDNAQVVISFSRDDDSLGDVTFLDSLHCVLCDLLEEISVEQSKCLRGVPDRQVHLILSVIAASLKGTIAVVDAYRKEVKL